MLSDDVRSALFARAQFHAKQDGERVHFRCPRHKDRTPSAWMAGGAWGCFACGFQESITTLATELGVALANGERALQDVVEATFDYVDEKGELLYQVVRYYPKRFVQRRPDGRGGWDWKTKGTRRVLYRLPEVLRAVQTGQNIYVVEGEKHVERLRKDGLVATTNAGGAGKWQPEFAEVLRGGNVVILPDNDKPGRDHAETIAHSLRRVAADVRLLELSGLPEKGDVIDWFNAGHTTQELEELAFDTPGAEPLPADAAQAKHAFPAPLSVHDLLQQPEPDDVFLVEPFLPADANVLLAAYPKCFKTGFLLSLAIAAASGKEFLGMFSVPRCNNVGVVLMEDRAHRIRRRLKRLCAGERMDLATLQGSLWHWFRPPLVLSDIAAVRALGEHAKAHELDLLIVDSWSYVSTGNPNDAEIVTPQLMALAELRDAVPGLCVILVHHARKTTQGSTHEERFTDIIRNSSAFGAWYDSGIVLSRENEQAPVKVRMELRDLPAPESFTFTLEDEFPAGPQNGLRPDGYLKIVASKEHPAIASQKAAGQRLAPVVLEIIRANPGLSKTNLRGRTTGRAADVDASLDFLQASGQIRRVGPGGNGKAGIYYANDS